jgi:hypothetical protein
VPPLPKPSNNNRARVIFFKVDATEPWARGPQVAGPNVRPPVR